VKVNLTTGTATDVYRQVDTATQSVMVPAETEPGLMRSAAGAKGWFGCEQKAFENGIPLALALALLVTVLLANAVWDESDAVHSRPRILRTPRWPSEPISYTSPR
jgi:hypothetical protein